MKALAIVWIVLISSGLIGGFVQLYKKSPDSALALILTIPACGVLIGLMYLTIIAIEVLVQ